MAFPSSSTTASSFVIRFARSAASCTAAIAYFFTSLAVLGVAEMAKLELNMLLLLSAFLAPLLMVLGARLFARLERRPLMGFTAIAAVFLLFPVTALAQAAASSPAPAQSPLVSFIVSYLPWFIGVLLTLFVSNQTGITARIQAWVDHAQAGSAQLYFALAVQKLDHLASDYAQKLLHDLELAKDSGRTLDVQQLVQVAGKDASDTLHEDGAQLLQDGLGIAGDALEKRIATAIQAKLSGSQLAGAAAAGAKAADAVKNEPLSQVAAELAKS
jgi:hypothetical protein